MSLYFKYIFMQIKSQMQYKLSFILELFSQTIVPLLVILKIYLLFNKFGRLENYNLEEILICFIITYISSAIATCIFCGFDRFSILIKRGIFDTMIVRPRNLILQILGHDFDLKRLGRIIFALIVGSYYFKNSNIQFNFLKVLTIFNMIIGGAGIFAGIFVFQGAICFITLEGLEIINVLSYGLEEVGSYPLDIFPKNIIRFLIFIVPFALTNYYPLKYLTGENNNIINIVLPYFGLVFLGLSFLFWNLCFKKYNSSGS